MIFCSLDHLIRIHSYHSYEKKDPPPLPSELCALKLSWELADEGVVIHPRTIGKIMKAEGMVRQYRVKRTKYKYIKAVRQPGDLVEIDVKYVPGTIENKRFFQYTAIDTASRWRHLAVYDAQSNSKSVRFLKDVMGLLPHKTSAIKTTTTYVIVVLMASHLIKP